MLILIVATDKVYDSCKEKDCLEDMRVILTRADQDIVNHAINVKAKKAEIIWVFTELEAVPFNRGFYTVDIKYFFNVTLEVFRGVGRPVEVNGLATFDKKVILFGSEGNAKVFSSKFNPSGQIPEIWRKNNLPKAVVEVVDPIALSAKLLERDRCCCDISHSLTNVPDFVHKCFDDDLVISDDEKRVLVTLGLFTIVKIERNVQLLIPAFDFCIPHKECLTATEENPCDLFSRLKFPVDEFFPPLRDELDVEREREIGGREQHRENRKEQHRR